MQSVAFVAPIELFTRHIEFSITATVPGAVAEFGLGIETLLVRDAKKDGSDHVDVSGQIDLEQCTVAPSQDELTIRIGSLQAFRFSADDEDAPLKKVGKKDRYVFKDKERKTTGFVDLFAKGGSRGKFKLNDNVFEGFVGGLDAIDVAFSWGSMDLSTSVSPRVTNAGRVASFNGNKDSYAEDVLVVTSITAKPSLGKLTWRAKVGGEAFDPTLQGANTTFTVGSWSATVAGGKHNWTKKGLHRGDGLRIKWNSKFSTLVVTVSEADLSDLVNPVHVSVENGLGFGQSRELSLAANKKGTVLSW